MRCVAFLSLMMLGACRSVTPGPATVVAKDPKGTFVWLMREVVVKDGLFSKRQHSVLFVCERTGIYPQCFSAEYHHASKPDVYWPAAAPCPGSDDCGVSVKPTHRQRPPARTSRGRDMRPQEGAGNTRMPSWTKPAKKEGNAPPAPSWTND